MYPPDNPQHYRCLSWIKNGSVVDYPHFCYDKKSIKEIRIGPI